MVRFVHWAPVGDLRHVARKGLRISRRWDSWNGVFCLPVPADLPATIFSTWKRQLRSTGNRKRRAAVVFEVPANDPVFFFPEDGDRYATARNEAVAVSASEALFRFERLFRSWTEYQPIYRLAERLNIYPEDLGVEDVCPFCSEVVIPRPILAGEIVRIEATKRRIHQPSIEEFHHA